MAEVSEEGLHTSDAQHNVAEQTEAAARGQEQQRIVGRERGEDLGSISDVVEANAEQGEEPEQHNGAKAEANAGGAAVLSQEEGNEDKAGDGHDRRLQQTMNKCSESRRHT